MCVGGIPQIPAFSLSVSGLSACQADVFFISDTLDEFQNSKPQEPVVVQTCAGSLGESFARLGLVPVCPNGAVTPMHRSWEFRVTHSKKPESRLATLGSVCAPCLRGTGSTMAPISSFVSDRQSHLSQIHSKKGEHLSQCIPGDLQIAASALGIYPPSPQEHCSTHWAPQDPQHRAIKLQSLNSAGYKYLA